MKCKADFGVMWMYVISMVVILVMLPAALMLCDWIIRHTTLKWMIPESANAKKSEKE